MESVVLDQLPRDVEVVQAADMADTQRIHTPKRPFQCHCSRRFTRLDNLRRHAQTVHQNEKIPPFAAAMQQESSLSHPKAYPSTDLVQQAGTYLGMTNISPQDAAIAAVATASGQRDPYALPYRGRIPPEWPTTTKRAWKGRNSKAIYHTNPGYSTRRQGLGPLTSSPSEHLSNLPKIPYTLPYHSLNSAYGMFGDSQTSNSGQPQLYSIDQEILWTELPSENIGSETDGLPMWEPDFDSISSFESLDSIRLATPDASSTMHSEDFIFPVTDQTCGPSGTTDPMTGLAIPGKRSSFGSVILLKLSVIDIWRIPSPIVSLEICSESSPFRKTNSFHTVESYTFFDNSSPTFEFFAQSLNYDFFHIPDDQGHAMSKLMSPIENVQGIDDQWDTDWGYTFNLKPPCKGDAADHLKVQHPMGATINPLIQESDAFSLFSYTRLKSAEWVSRNGEFITNDPRFLTIQDINFGGRWFNMEVISMIKNSCLLAKKFQITPSASVGSQTRVLETEEEFTLPKIGPSLEVDEDCEDNLRFSESANAILPTVGTTLKTDIESYWEDDENDESEESCESIGSALDNFQPRILEGHALLEPVLESRKSKLIDRLMGEFWIIFDQLQNTDIIAHNGNSPSTEANAAISSVPTVAKNFSTFSLPGSKRRLDDEKDPESDDDIQRRSGPTKNGSDRFDVSSNRGNFACPYRKHNSRKYNITEWRTCALTSHNTIARVKLVSSIFSSCKSRTNNKLQGPPLQTSSDLPVPPM